MTDFPYMKGNAAMALGASYFEVPLFSPVLADLWQGCSPSEFPDTWKKGVADCKWLVDDPYDTGEMLPRFDRILNLYPWGEYNVPEGTEKIDYEMYDSEKMNGDLEHLSDLVFHWLEEGYKVLVHCQAGLNRSSLVIGHVLITKFGMNPEEAIKKIRQRSEMCLCNPTFHDYLEGL